MVVSRDVDHARFSTMGCCSTSCSSLFPEFHIRLSFHTRAGFARELGRRFLRFACATCCCAVHCDELPEYCAKRLRAIKCQASMWHPHHYHHSLNSVTKQKTLPRVYVKHNHGHHESYGSCNYMKHDASGSKRHCRVVFTGTTIHMDHVRCIRT